MNNPEEIKKILTPIIVAQYYLGQGRRKGNKIWYKAPWRNERTASLMVDNKSFHDFGENWDGDVIDFVGKIFNIDFLTSMKILSKDFGLPEGEKIPKEFEEYIKRKHEEDVQIKKKLNNWFNNTLSKLCNELHVWKKMIPHLKKEALAIAYSKEQYIDYLIDEFINATEEERVELWRDKEEIEKCLNVNNVEKLQNQVRNKTKK